MNEGTRAALDSRANIRAALGCAQTERTVDAVRRIVAERDALRIENEALRRAARQFWEREEGKHAAE